MTSSNDIRAAFVDFFAANKHEVVPSGPLVPPNDPTLLFTNAGMVQFKNVFTGVETRPYTRAVTAQKCVRAGGKHNDLDNVGYTRRHHTFFEMLGSFSFGDYFKELAIELAWRLITKEFKIDPERLIATVYVDDDDAYNAWKKVAKLPEKRLLRIDSTDNFWSMGDVGPCGPCTEIFYDHGPGLDGGPPGSGKEGDRFVEIWNLVFMQYEQTEDGKRVDLPRQSVDTGMGLERLAAVLQGVHDNYDTDILRALVLASAELTGKPADGPQKISHRVIADHLRACAFLIADGVLPSNEGRGYVLRRIMRRAMRHVHLLGARQPEMYRLVPVLVAQMGQAYPELMRAQPLITETLRHEESRFRELLARGLKLLDEETKRLSKGGALPGEVAFKLYDTFGFPLDLTEDVLRSRGLTVESAGFEAAMERQRAEARKSWTGSGEAAQERVWFEIRERAGATEFLGYAEDEAEGEIVALVKAGAEVDALEKGEEGAVVTNQTPFYGEAGGQMGDTGLLTTEHGAEFEVTDTRRQAGDLFVHLGRLVKGALKRGEIADMKIDSARRTKLRANHSATHLLHEALRRRLGEHVTQKGSLVAPDRLRFDFSHPRALSQDELDDIETEVNERVRVNSDVVTRFMTPKEAVDKGALALFGEKYGDEVRVLSMGHRDGERYSTELCGGTHVRRTGDIGVFRIIGESAVGSGVRRIEALTGQAAMDYMDAQAALLNQIAAHLKVAPADVPARVSALMDERKKLERELTETRKQLATGGGGAAAEPAFKDLGGVKFAGKLLGDVPAKELKPMADELKKQIGSGIIALASSAEGKASLVVAVTADLTSRFDAVQLVRVGSETLGGKGGGGRPDMAQAGGPNVEALGRAVEAIEKAVSSGGAAAA